MMKNYPTEKAQKPRPRIFINHDMEMCLNDLGRFWVKRDGSPMTYTDIVRLALFNLAAQSDLDIMPHLSLVAAALKDVEVEADELDHLWDEIETSEHGHELARNLIESLFRLQTVLNESAELLRDKALCSGGQKGEHREDEI